MDPITLHVDPQDYFQKGRTKISEVMKHLQDIVHWYKGFPEKVGLVDEIMAYLQSLQRQVVQEISQIGRKNEEIDMVNTNVENSSCSKRKRCSKVSEDIIKHIGEDGKECLRNPCGAEDQTKEKSVIDPEKNGSDLVRRVIKYGLKGIKNNILDVYEQEKDKLHAYLNKLTCRFNVRFDWLVESKLEICLVTIWFIDDSWDLKNRIISLGEYTGNVHERVKSLLVDWNIDKKICSMLRSCEVLKEKEDENICNWFNERGSLPFIGNCLPVNVLLEICFFELIMLSRNNISSKLYKVEDYVRTHKNRFESAVEEAMSMGKEVTSRSVPPSSTFMEFIVLEWVMGCKEALCELEHIDPHFKSINFTKEDWDDATLLYNGWKVLKELGGVACKLLGAKYKTTNVYFPTVSQICSKLVQFEKSDNYYLREYFDAYWKSSKLVLVTILILDPRFKMVFIVEHFSKVMDGNDADVHINRIIDDVTNIFNDYAKGIINSISSSSPDSELNRYLRDSICPPGEELDILEWWRVNSPTYPTLARMARDCLSIPIFAAPTRLDRSLKAEIEDVCLESPYDDDFKWKLACTKIWLKTPDYN